MSSDPKHDWPTAAYLLEQHIKNKIKYFKDELGRDLKEIYGYSDRGEFSASGFLAALSLIKERLGLERLVWTFTCPQHGKCKCDAEGHVIKTCTNQGVDGGKIKYVPNEENYDVTLIRYLSKKLMNNKNIMRRFFSIDINAVNHIKQEQFCKTLKNISRYHQFEILNNGVVLRRSLDCKCTHCLNVNPMQWDKDQCTNGHVVGEWERCKISMKTHDFIWIKDKNNQNDNGNSNQNNNLQNDDEYKYSEDEDEDMDVDSDIGDDESSSSSDDDDDSSESEYVQNYNDYRERGGICFEFCGVDSNSANYKSNLIECGTCQKKYHLKCAIDLTGHDPKANIDYQCVECYSEMLM